MLFYGKTTVIHLVRHPERGRGKIEWRVSSIHRSYKGKFYFLFLNFISLCRICFMDEVECFFE
jgi:hypothetical protein